MHSELEITKGYPEFRRYEVKKMHLIMDGTKLEDQFIND